jgi:hypothetical protein
VPPSVKEASELVHTITLEQRGSAGRAAAPAPIGHLLQAIPTLSRQCVAMRFQRRSRTHRGGRPPAWLVAASDVRLLDACTDRGVCLRFDAPQLGEAASEIYEQGDFWSQRPDPEDTAFDLLGDVLADVGGALEDSQRVDQDLLKSVAGLGHVVNGSFQRMLVEGRRYAAGNAAVLDRSVIRSAGELWSKTPDPRRVRLVGVLDAVRISRQTFALRLDDGHEVRGVLGSSAFDELLELFGSKRRVLVRGDAVYRASGQLLLVDAEDVSPGEGEPDLWSRLPGPADGMLDAGQLRRRQTRTTGLSAIVGKWPGTETDEEIEAALSELRR